MSENGPPDDGRTLPMSRYPDPAAGYTVEGGVPTVAATNRAFERVLGAVDPGVTLPDALDRFGVSTPDEDAELADLLVGADQRTVYLETDEGNYHARVLPPTDDDDGYVLFVDAAAVDDPGTGAGADGDSGADERPDAPETELGIDRVASVLSHDLRNPLDVAEARLRAGRERGEDEHFEHVAAAHDRMERIIEDVLTLSRGEEVVDPDDAVDLEAIAQSAWGTVETEGATLTVADALPTTVADRDRTERLFENLFRNAVEHGSTSPPSHAREDAVEHGPDDVTITVGDRPDGFYVENDGPGIPADERERVFESGVTSSESDTGFGLAIVEEIAAAHGWDVVATEGSDGGARFEITGVDRRK